MNTTIENYLRLTVTDCKRLGFFVPDAATTGVVRWTQGNEVIASVHFETNLAGTVPFAVVDYHYRGTPVHAELSLRFKPSNLKEGTGYYYFVCPVTGLSCRNLYLVNGRFLSRAAFRPLYKKQAETRTGKRNVALAAVAALGEYERIAGEKYRRMTYRGRLTPWGRKVEKYAARAGVSFELMLHRVKTKGWRDV